MKDRTERRQFVRICATLSREKPVVIKCGINSAVALLVNFGRGGAEVDIGDCNLEWIDGYSTLCLSFQGSGQPFDVLAKLVRRDGSHLGVKFWHLTPGDERNVQLKVVSMQIARLASRSGSQATN
jgi:hypothetical protein